MFILFPAMMKESFDGWVQDRLELSLFLSSGHRSYSVPPPPIGCQMKEGFDDSRSLLQGALEYEKYMLNETVLTSQL